MAFRPTEVLFSPTADCNLSCAHCAAPRSKTRLPVKIAGSFLLQCKSAGVKRVSFTGGEPFLYPEFLYSVTKLAVREGMLFGRIMTNGVWHRSRKELETILKNLYAAGYDGDICLSVDAFHKQNIAKLCGFIDTVISIWKRPDMVSIAWVGGAMDAQSVRKISEVTRRTRSAFLRKTRIEFSPVGSARRLKDPWGKKWFTEDYCRGPGNVLFIEPDGDVKPCCGYAAGYGSLTIGNIRRDSLRAMIKNAERSKFIHAVFANGLNGIRKACERMGFEFPGRTKDHCFFCAFLQTEVPRAVLAGALKNLKAVLIGILLSSLFVTPVTAESVSLKKSGDYRLIEVKVAQKVAIPRWYHEGLFYDDGTIWVANGQKGNIWAVDLKTGKVLKEVCPYGEFTESMIKEPDGSWLVTDWDDKKLYRSKIERSTLTENTVLFDFSPARPAGLVRVNDRYFVITWTRGMGTRFGIVILDKEFRQTDAVAINFIEEPAHMAWDGKALWITSWYSRKVYRVDPETWEITGFFRTPFGKATGITWDGKYLWITGTYSPLYRIEVSE